MAGMKVKVLFTLRVAVVVLGIVEILHTYLKKTDIDIINKFKKFENLY
jgi:hypothetical protein